MSRTTRVHSISRLLGICHTYATRRPQETAKQTQRSEKSVSLKVLAGRRGKRPALERWGGPFIGLGVGGDSQRHHGVSRDEAVLVPHP